MIYSEKIVVKTTTLEEAEKTYFALSAIGWKIFKVIKPTGYFSFYGYKFSMYK